MVVTYQSAKPGMTSDAIVKKVNDWGVVIQFEDSSATAIVLKEDCDDNEVEDVRALYAVGDKVRAVVLEKDEKEKRIRASLKSSLLPANEAMEEEPVKDMEEEMIESEESESASESASESEEEESESEKEDTPAAGFGWTDFTPVEEEKKEVVAAPAKPKKLSERTIASIEESLAKSESLPESGQDFERLLVSNPTSSHLWLRYASWLLSITEVAKARAVIRRGLKSIPVHMEEERSNLWLALMNLESEYGDEEALEAVFKEAKQAMEPKQAYLHLAKIYEVKKDSANGYNWWKQIA